LRRLSLGAVWQAVSVAIDPAPLTCDQFRYAFAGTVGEVEAKHLYETYAVPAPGLPVFQAGVTNFNPWTEAKGFRRCPIPRFPRAIETCLRDRSSLISPPFARMEVPKAA